MLSAVALFVFGSIALLAFLDVGVNHYGWTGIAVFFGYMGFDDGTRFHERVGTAFGVWVYGNAAPDTRARRILDVFPSYEWQVLLFLGRLCEGSRSWSITINGRGSR
jgi:hypothetical protein